MIQRTNLRVQDSKFNFYDRVTHEIVTRRVVKRTWKTSSTSSSRHAWAGNSTRQGLQPDLDEQRFCSIANPMPQRGIGLQPKVARNELPWVTVRKWESTP